MTTSNTFRYSLDKSARKFNCPQCGKKRFVKYTDVLTGEYLDGNYGRCDRSDSCAFTAYPPSGNLAYRIELMSLIDISPKSYQITDHRYFKHFVPKSQVLEVNPSNIWIKEWWLKTSKIDYTQSECKIFNNGVDVLNPLINIKPKENQETSYHSMELAQDIISSKKDCNLAIYLKSKFSSDKVSNAMASYYTGCTDDFWNNSTCFFQVDENSRVRAGKIMLYSKNDGRRVKTPGPHINWMHKANKSSDFNLSQCLFGLCLLKDSDPNKPIALVESEKTAIVMSIFNNDCTWMACGSKTAINENILSPIKHRAIVLYPDKGSAQKWGLKAESLRGKGFNIGVSTFIEDMESMPPGSDIADVYLT